MGFFLIILLFIVPGIMSHYWNRSWSTYDKCDKYNPDNPNYVNKEKDKYR